MIFYKDLNGSYRVTIDGVLSVIPETLCSLRFRGSKVTLFRHLVNTTIFEAVEVTEILKSDTPGDYYADVEDFLDTNSGAAGGAVTIVGESGSAAEVDAAGQLHIVGSSKLCEGNCTETPILASEVWTGIAQNILAYNGLAVFVTSDVLGFLEVQFSKDGVNGWRTSETYVVNAGDEKWFTPPTFGAYFRLKYTNNTTNQTVFEITTKLSKFPFKWSSHNIEEPISGGDDAELVKSVLTGMTPFGVFENANLSGFKNLNVAIAEIVSDAFGRQKVSLPTSLLDSVIEHDMDNIFVDYLTNGAGAVVFDEVNNVVDMAVTNNGDYAIIETIANGKYQPGKALEFVASTLMTSQENVIKRCGYCTVRYHNVIATNIIQNGIYFENNNGTLSWNIVKNGTVTETVTQENWNTDKLDGNGASTFDLNTDYVQLPALDLQFLAVGTVRVGFNINGVDVFCHKFYHANTPNFVSTYMHTANLPVHYSITSTGSTGSMKAIGYSVASGGGLDALGKLNFVDVDDITIANGVTELMIGLRLKELYYNSFVKMLSAEIISIGKSNFRWMLLMNPTYTGTVTWVDEDGSAVQVAKNNGNVIATEADRGLKIASGLSSDKTRTADGDFDNSLRLAKKLDGTMIEIWLAIQAINGDDFYASLNYQDLF